MDLSPGCAPLGVLCAGFSDDQLEAIADVVETSFLRPVPIVALSESDLAPRVALRDVLAQMGGRECGIRDSNI